MPLQRMERRVRVLGTPDDRPVLCRVAQSESRSGVNLTPSGSAPAADDVPRGRERSPRLVRIGRRRWPKQGTAEQWIKEGKAATHWTRLSCHRFRANKVRLPASG